MRASVVIPAYNEGRVIDRCLTWLREVGDVRVVVAANGCTDDTVARARAFSVEVVEVNRPSKVAALNAADERAGDVFPRLYLDADIELSPAAVDTMIERLRSIDRPVLLTPYLELDLTGSHPLIKSFYRAFLAMPYVAEGIGGTGCYAVNRAGRERWGDFPDLVADDLFVQGRFTADERLHVDARSTTRGPRTLKGLLAVRTRTYQGNRGAAVSGLAGELTGTTASSARALAVLVRRRRVRVIDALVYVAVNLEARRRARRLRPDAPWLTDHSSRG